MAIGNPCFSSLLLACMHRLALRRFLLLTAGTPLPCKVHEAFTVASACRPFNSSHAATHPHITAPAAMTYWSKACTAQYHRPLWQQQLANSASCIFVVSMLRSCSHRPPLRIGHCCAACCVPCA